MEWNGFQTSLSEEGVARRICMPKLGTRDWYMPNWKRSEVARSCQCPARGTSSFLRHSPPLMYFKMHLHSRFRSPFHGKLIWKGSKLYRLKPKSSSNWDSVFYSLWMWDHPFYLLYAFFQIVAAHAAMRAEWIPMSPNGDAATETVKWRNAGKGSHSRSKPPDNPPWISMRRCRSISCIQNCREWNRCQCIPSIPCESYHIIMKFCKPQSDSSKQRTPSLNPNQEKDPQGRFDHVPGDGWRGLTDALALECHRRRVVGLLDHWLLRECRQTLWWRNLLSCN